MDVNSNAFAASVALNGVTSSAARESAVFIETSSAATVQSFITGWFGSAAPAGLQIGTCSGAGARA